MRQANRSRMSIAAAVAVVGGLWCGSLSVAAPKDDAAGDIVAGAWQHHKVTFNYYGITSKYTCSGLEDKVRVILLQLGARKDVHVNASGCAGPIDTPSHTAWVDADFYTLAPADAGGPDTVPARWTAVQVAPRRPYSVGDGDCELVQGMKDLISKNFGLRDLEYRTECPFRDYVQDGFAVKGFALRAQSAPSSAPPG
jgi:hypothetical protein